MKKVRLVTWIVTFALLFGTLNFFLSGDEPEPPPEQAVAATTSPEQTFLHEPLEGLQPAQHRVTPPPLPPPALVPAVPVPPPPPPARIRAAEPAAALVAGPYGVEDDPEWAEAAPVRGAPALGAVAGGVQREVEIGSCTDGGGLPPHTRARASQPRLRRRRRRRRSDWRRSAHARPAPRAGEAGYVHFCADLAPADDRGRARTGLVSNVEFEASWGGCWVKVCRSGLPVHPPCPALPRRTPAR